VIVDDTPIGEPYLPAGQKKRDRDRTNYDSESRQPAPASKREISDTACSQ
jgi:hypothetical protein